MKYSYELHHTEELISPCLVYYIDIIRENIEKAIQIAGSPERLWPHVKSHKSIDMVKLQMEYGIVRFKAATIPEAEMAAEAGAKEIILAYPLIGPNQKRFLRLTQAYPDTVFYGVGDDVEQLRLLSNLCEEEGVQLPVLADVNMGMNRTGVEVEHLEDLYRTASKFPGIRLCGLHCYDGNHNHKDIGQRKAEVSVVDEEIMEIMKCLQADGLECQLVVAGGTPAFPCHAEGTQWYLSPGTAFLTDAGYYINLPELPFIPAAAVMTRVISHPAKGMFTVDLGYKGIAADPVGQRGYIVGLEEAESVVHSEEHWAFRLEDESKIPEIGTCLYVIPTHICPTSALYPEISVARGGEITEVWSVTARNRKITY